MEFLRNASKTVDPRSELCGHVTRPPNETQLRQNISRSRSELLHAQQAVVRRAKGSDRGSEVQGMGWDGARHVTERRQTYKQRTPLLLLFSSVQAEVLRGHRWRSGA